MQKRVTGKIAPITKFNRNKDIPPITLFNVNHKDLIYTLNNELNHTNFQISCENSNKALLFLSNYDDFVKTKKILTDNKTKYFTHLASSEKQSKYIIKGIAPSFESQDIIDEIKRNFPNLPNFEITNFNPSNFEQRIFNL